LELSAWTASTPPRPTAPTMEAMLIDPDSVDAHDVTIAMAKANMSLNITRTVLDRVVRAWKDIINTR